MAAALTLGAQISFEAHDRYSQSVPPRDWSGALQFFHTVSSTSCPHPKFLFSDIVSDFESQLAIASVSPISSST